MEFEATLENYDHRVTVDLNAIGTLEGWDVEILKVTESTRVTKVSVAD